MARKRRRRRWLGESRARRDGRISARRDGALVEFLAAIEPTYLARAPKGQALLVAARFAPLIPGPMRAIDVAAAEDALGRATRRGGGALGPNTRRKYAGDLGAVWEMAVARGWADRNPWRDVAGPAALQKAVPYLDADQRDRLLSACVTGQPRQLEVFVAMILETGLRLEEALALRWADRTGRFLTVRRAKGGKTRTLKLTARAAEILDTERLLHPPGRDEEYVFDRAQVRLRDLYRACAEAGLPRLGFHALRHVFATRCARAGVPLYALSKILGHQRSQMTERYAGHSPAELAAGGIDELERSEGEPKS